MIDYETTKKFYSTTANWGTDIYSYFTTRVYIKNFVHKTLDTLNIGPDTKILNAGSAGNTYYDEGEQFHIDLVESKLRGVKNAIVGNIINMPYEDEFFDVVICV